MAQPPQALNADPTAGISHFAVRLPQYWSHNPAIWFHQVDCQFALANITAQLTKYRHVVSALPPDVAAEVTDLLLAPLPANPYDALRNAIIERTTQSERKRLQQLLSAEEIGDRRPTQFLRHMQALLGARASTFDEQILKELFLQRLPPTVQVLLATAANLPLSQLAAHADAIVDATSSFPPGIPTPPGLGHIAHLPPTPVTPTPAPVQPHAGASDTQQELLALLSALRSDIRNRPNSRDSRGSPARRGAPSRSPPRRQRPRTPPRDNPSSFCWYHWTFGSRARNCASPCAWPGNPPEGR